MIILDGLGDRSVPAFGGKTPLESAATPNMDRLAATGHSGLVDPMFPGLPLDTHTATGLLFGLPRQMAMKLARGPVEAAGIGIANDPEAVYLRANLATLNTIDNNRYEILDRRSGRIDQGVGSLIGSLGEMELGDGIKASLHPASQHRVVVKLTGPDLSVAITNTDPGERYRETGLLDSQAKIPADPQAVRTAHAINRLTRQVYEKLCAHPLNLQRQTLGLPPANGIICRSPGRLPHLQTLIQRYRLKTAVVAGEKTILGLAAMLGYSQITEPTFTALPDTDLETKVIRSKLALQEHDLVYLHVKGPDICSHDQNPAAKRDLLESIDNALAPLVSEDLVIGITGDHSTDSNSGRHTGDPVPSLVYAPYGRIDACQTFSELAASRGGLGRITSLGFLTSMLDLMNLLDNYHPDDIDLFQ
jgi:2,3-bisphosphoglycerate-independent phosphoglycerate mutase